MNRRDFLTGSIATAALPLSILSGPRRLDAAPVEEKPGVAVLLVDTDRVQSRIDPRIYGQFLEHPDAITPVVRSLNYARDLTVDLNPYTVAVIEIRA